MVHFTVTLPREMGRRRAVKWGVGHWKRKELEIWDGDMVCVCMHGARGLLQVFDDGKTDCCCFAFGCLCKIFTVHAVMQLENVWGSLWDESVSLSVWYMPYKLYGAGVRVCRCAGACGSWRSRTAGSCERIRPDESMRYLCPAFPSPQRR